MKEMSAFGAGEELTDTVRNRARARVFLLADRAGRWTYRIRPAAGSQGLAPRGFWLLLSTQK